MHWPLGRYGLWLPQADPVWKLKACRATRWLWDAALGWGRRFRRS